MTIRPSWDFTARHARYRLLLHGSAVGRSLRGVQCAPTFDALGVIENLKLSPARCETDVLAVRCRFGLSYQPATPAGTRPGDGSRSTGFVSEPAKYDRSSASLRREKKRRKFSPGFLSSR